MAGCRLSLKYLSRLVESLYSQVILFSVTKDAAVQSASVPGASTLLS